MAIYAEELSSSSSIDEYTRFNYKLNTVKQIQIS